MEKQVLSREQMQKLIDIGVDVSKASMCWMVSVSGEQFLIPNEENSTLSIILENEFLIKQYIPTFTLQDILGILPKRIIVKGGIVCTWKLTKEGIAYWNEDSRGIIHGESNNLLEAAFNMLKWCKQNKYI